MAACDILDFRCIYVSEIAGSILVAILLAAILYFIMASRLNWGFNTTVGLLFPAILIIGLSLAGFSAIFAFATVMVGFFLSWILNRIFGNR